VDFLAPKGTNSLDRSRCRSDLDSAGRRNIEIRAAKRRRGCAQRLHNRKNTSNSLAIDGTRNDYVAMFRVGGNLPVPIGKAQEQIYRGMCELHRCYLRVWKVKFMERTYVLQCGCTSAVDTSVLIGGFFCPKLA
jgi:hypothetical protein